MKYTIFAIPILFVSMLVLSGCSATGHDKLITQKDLTYAEVDMVFVDLKPFDNVNVALEGLGYDGDMLAQSMHQTNLNASMQAGYNAQAGLAGALIGGMIVKEAQVNSQIKEKNERVLGFLHDLKKQNWKMYWRNIYSEPAKLLVFSDDPAQPYLKHKLHITPVLQVAADYQSLHMVAEAEILDTKGKSLYRNYFYLQSRALLDKNESLMQLSFKDQQWFESLLSQMIQPLPALIRNELMTSADNTKSSAPIRFVNQSGEYYERGYLLGIKDGFITFRTLRGEVKHYPCDKLI